MNDKVTYLMQFSDQIQTVHDQLVNVIEDSKCDTLFKRKVILSLV